jgi:CDP-glycerol glycerophosphotransferase
MMITDYSSVMFDYALLNKPMMFFTYDLESYSEDTRGVYFDISKEAPGPLVFTTDELISAVKNIDEEIKKIEKRVSDFYDKYLTYECGESAKKVVEEVIKPSTPPAVPKKPKRGIFSFFSKK